MALFVSPRSMLVLIHRWVGLVMAGFLLIAGLTGALLAWNDELEAAVSPQLFRISAPEAGAERFDLLVLRERVQAAHPEAVVRSVRLDVEPGRAVIFPLFGRPDPATGKEAELPNNQVFVNPYTGEVLGERKWGDITQGVKNLMPFIYRLHYSLALDVVGSYTFGIIALLWTLDCFVGAYLTFPAATRKSPAQRVNTRRPWLARWWPSWKVRWGGGSYKLNFDLHRAGGLWVWAMLFVLAWSSVAFNLSEVYDPVMKTLFAHQPDGAAPQQGTRPTLSPTLDWQAARETGRNLMADQARQHDFRVLAEHALRYEPATDTFSYHVRSSRDVAERWGATIVRFEADTGALRKRWLPTGGASGDTIRTWITSLHMAALWGVPFKLFVCMMGVVVAMLSVTGVIIWARKRSSRMKSEQRNRAESVRASLRPHGASVDVAEEG